MHARTRITRNDFKAFERVPKKRVHGAFFSLTAFSLPNAMKHSQYTCVISKKTARKAVDRNRAKRRCRALLKDCIGARTNSVCVVTIKPSALKATYSDLKEDISSLLKKALQ